MPIFSMLRAAPIYFASSRETDCCCRFRGSLLLLPNARIDRARTERRQIQVLDKSNVIRAPVEWVVMPRRI